MPNSACFACETKSFFFCSCVSMYSCVLLRQCALVSFCPFFCLCVSVLSCILYFSYGFGHVNIFVDISHSKPMWHWAYVYSSFFSVSVWISISGWVIICVLKQTYFGMTTLVCVLAFCVSASLCAFFFASSVFVSICPSVYMF